MKFVFNSVKIPQKVSASDWYSWVWQMQNRLKTEKDFEAYINLSANELRGFEKPKDKTLEFQISCTPYYAALTQTSPALRETIIPTGSEFEPGVQQMNDPLGEGKNLSSSPRLVHRYSDRALLLVTDTCGSYCRYCFRKYFTGHGHGFVASKEYAEALTYLQKHKGVREVILSGGDPLTLSNKQIEKIISDLRRIDHLEIIRVASRFPVFCPMRIDKELVQIFRAHKPIYFMSHINHPHELTLESAEALEKLVDHGIPVFNQAVLLNGVNNHEAVIQALNRRLLYLRVKPHYMFQCDPSHGTDHFRTRIETGERIQKALWGNLSGLAMSQHSLDIPGGGGKLTLVPNFELEAGSWGRRFKGWDGVEGTYLNPVVPEKEPLGLAEFEEEWQQIRFSRDEQI